MPKKMEHKGNGVAMDWIDYRQSAWIREEILSTSKLQGYHGTIRNNQNNHLQLLHLHFLNGNMMVDYSNVFCKDYPLLLLGRKHLHLYKYVQVSGKDNFLP